MFCQSRNVRQILRELLDKYENLKQKKKRYKYKAEDEDDKSEDEDKVITIFFKSIVCFHSTV